MTESVAKSAPPRHRLYFWLMDASLVGIVIFIASVIFESATGKEAFGLAAPMSGIVGLLLLVLILVIPLLLIVLKPLRDEYADMLWRRTVGPLVVLMAMTPLLYFASIWLFYAISTDPTTLSGLDWLYEEQSGFESVSAAWAIFNMVFVVIFQFLRWRDSR